DFAMCQPARANHPISSSLNVMGPNPLVYPQNYNPDAEPTDPRSAREAQVQTETASQPSTSYEPQPGPSSEEVAKTRNMQTFESLLAVVKNEMGENSKE